MGQSLCLAGQVIDSEALLRTHPPAAPSASQAGVDSNSSSAHLPAERRCSCCWSREGKWRRHRKGSEATRRLNISVVVRERARERERVGERERFVWQKMRPRTSVCRVCPGGAHSVSWSGCFSDYQGYNFPPQRDTSTAYPRLKWQQDRRLCHVL